MPGRSGRRATPELRRFSSGQSARRAKDRASSNLLDLIAMIAAPRQRCSHSPNGATPRPSASRIFVIASTAIFFLSSEASSSEDTDSDLRRASISDMAAV